MAVSAAFFCFLAYLVAGAAVVITRAAGGSWPWAAIVAVVALVGYGRALFALGRCISR